jgi:hypothetical protein
MKKDYSVASYVNIRRLSGGDSVVVHKTKRYTKLKTSRYHNCQHKLATLTKCAEMLMRYLTEIMDDTNGITHTKMMRNRFRYQMSKNCSLVYADDTVKKAFYELVAQDLVIMYIGKSDYLVNPKYYFNGTETDRIQLIQHLIPWAKQEVPVHQRMLDALGV